MTELQIQRCTACAAHWFPERLRCPKCGGALQWVPAGEGTVEEHTVLARQDDVRLASVRLDKGPVVIARLTYEAKTRVRLITHHSAIHTQ